MYVKFSGSTVPVFTNNDSSHWGTDGYNVVSGERWPVLLTSVIPDSLHLPTPFLITSFNKVTGTRSATNSAGITISADVTTTYRELRRNGVLLGISYGGIPDTAQPGVIMVDPATDYFYAFTEYGPLIFDATGNLSATLPADAFYNYDAANGGVGTSVTSTLSFYNTWYHFTLPQTSGATAISTSSFSSKFRFNRTLDVISSTFATKKFALSCSVTTLASSIANFSLTRLYKRTLTAVSTNVSTKTHLFLRGFIAFAHSNHISTATTKKLFGNLWSIIYAGTKFIGAKFNSNVSATSTDGSTWVSHTLPSTSKWAGIATNGTTTIAIENSTISKTSDGITWTSVALPNSRNWKSISALGSIFVITSLQSDKCAVSSDNGDTWTEYTMPLISNWTSIDNNGSIFCAVSDSGICAVSSDGISWLSYTMPDAIQYNSIVWNLGQFTAIASGPTDKAAISSDGINWVRITMPAVKDWRSIGKGFTVNNV